MGAREELIQLKERSGLTWKGLSEHFGIPYRTVQDWYMGRRKMPEYLLRLMMYRAGTERENERGGTAILADRLKDYASGPLYPFHMPGHKRRCAPAPDLPFGWDITEVEGMDDLHHPEGILKEAMERSAALFGSRRTFYLVGGSTAGILASLYAVFRPGDEAVIARNSHKSVYHAAELLDLKVCWISPEVDPVFGTARSIEAAAVEAALAAHPGARGVVLTSPSYDGVVSDVGRIAKLCHGKGLPLIVDAAHGAHFGLFERDYFPESPVALGADLCVMSAHKTLPSLTQTALLHLNGDLVEEERLTHALSVFQTSSPSYPLMASLDGCTGILRERGEELFAAWREGLERFYEEAGAWRHLRVLGSGGVWGHDPSKIIVCGNGCLLGGEPLTGARLEDFVRREYALEPEMHAGTCVTFLTSCCDDDEGMERLSEALAALDGEVLLGAERREEALPLPERACSIGEALRGEREYIPLREAAGRICAAYVLPYPPGIPALVPGERIPAETADSIRKRIGDGDNVIIEAPEGMLPVLRKG